MTEQNQETAVLTVTKDELGVLAALVTAHAQPLTTLNVFQDFSGGFGEACRFTDKAADIIAELDRRIADEFPDTTSGANWDQWVTTLSDDGAETP